MSVRRKFFLIFIFIMIDIGILIGYLVVRDATMLNNLKNEVEEISKLDLAKDRFNTKIKCSGNYGVIEKTIKGFLDEYSLSIQDTMSIVEDKEFTKILSYENYKNDGPKFEKSFKYLKENRDKFNNSINELIVYLNEDSIIEYGEKRINDNYSLNLYRELMLDKKMTSNYESTKGLLYKTKDRINNIFDTSKKVLEYLKDNQDSWKIEDKEIQFNSQEKFDGYEKILKNINES